MELARQIWLMQQELVALAEKKGCLILNDPDIYEKSCLIDKMIVELIKSQQPKGYASDEGPLFVVGMGGAGKFL